MNKTPLEYVQEKGWNYKEKGRELYIQRCPYCDDGKKGNYNHFSINQDTKVYHCHKCKTGGKLSELMEYLGDVGQNYGYTKPPEVKRYKEPKKPKAYTRPPERQGITHTEEQYKKCEQERGISADILKRYSVGFGKHYFSEAGQTKEAIIYPYYNENLELFNRKYRSADKDFQTETNAEKGFYGLQFIDYGKEYLYVTEGEDDCHAMVQYGFDNVVSVPYGAGNFTPAMEETVKRFKTVYMIYDMDERGQKGARKFAAGAGYEKCKNVLLQYKDARDCLLKGVTVEQIQQAIDEAEYLPDPEAPIQEKTLLEVLLEKHKTDSERDAGELLGYGLNKFSQLCKHIDGLQPGYYIISAATNSGKTAFVVNLCLDVLESNQDVKVIYFSLDDSRNVILNRFIACKAAMEINKVQKFKDIDAGERERIEKAYSDTPGGLYSLAEQNRLMIWDISEVQDVEKADKIIKQNTRVPLVVFIDGLYNLSVGAGNYELRKENIMRATKVKALVDTYGIPIICTGETTKATDGKQPGLKDVMESGKYLYNANLIWTIGPKEDNPEKFKADDEPIIILSYEKNKLSWYKGTQDLIFRRKSGIIEEIGGYPDGDTGFFK